MTKKRHTPERIVTLLRQVEVAVGNGKATPQACKEAAITEQTYYRWRKEYGGLKLAQAKRLKELERENSRLKRVVAELSLEKPREDHSPRAPLARPRRRSRLAPQFLELRGHVVPGRAFRDIRDLLHRPFDAHTVLVGVHLRPFLGQLRRDRAVAGASQPILHGIAPSHSQALGFPLGPG